MVINIPLTSTRYDDKLYYQPVTFMPERWLRGQPGHQHNIHPFASIPFGFGPRACIGIYKTLLNQNIPYSVNTIL